MKKPDTIAENGLEPDVRRKLNAVIRYLDTLDVLATDEMQIDRTARGKFLRLKGGNNTDNNQAPRWG